MNRIRLRRRFRMVLPILALAFFIPAVLAVRMTGAVEAGEGLANPNTEELREKWGVEIVSLRQGAGGYILDFRYRVLDPVKAAPLADRKINPFLIDQATDTKFIVPAPAKVGALRNKPMHYKRDRVYFIQFANPGKFIKPGSLVTVAIGEFQAKNITVQ